MGFLKTMTLFQKTKPFPITDYRSPNCIALCLNTKKSVLSHQTSVINSKPPSLKPTKNKNKKTTQTTNKIRGTNHETRVQKLPLSCCPTPDNQNTHLTSTLDLEQETAIPSHSKKLKTFSCSFCYG